MRLQQPDFFLIVNDKFYVLYCLRRSSIVAFYITGIPIYYRVKLSGYSYVYTKVILTLTSGILSFKSTSTAYYIFLCDSAATF